MTTPKLALPELTVGQAGKELTHNQALAVLDQLAQAVVVDKDLATPPGSPANGAMYIVAAGATGLWTGKSGQLAFWLTSVGAWTFASPVNGWSAWVADEAKRYELVAGAWVLSTSALGLGTAATANLTSTINDTTVGRVVKVGDYGWLGGASIEITTGSCNDLVTPGRYAVTTTKTTDCPPTAEAAAFLIDVVLRGNGLVQQMAYPTAPLIGRQGMWIRRRSTSLVWDSAWTRIWDSSSANEVTIDTGSIGYGIGSGGTVTQATNKSTGVTLNKPSGEITLSAASLASNTSVSFTLTNSKIASSDVPAVAIKSGATAGGYVLQADAVASGSCRISIRNMTAGALAEAVVLQFNLVKGATA